MGTIPIQNTIDVSLVESPKGLGNYATNSIYLLTNEQPLSPKPYIWAINAQDIINEYGTNSKTAEMAQGLFTPSQNLRTGTGQVLVIPYSGTDATVASATTVEIISAKITNFQKVSNGKLTINIDGVDYTSTKLNFKAVTQVDDIVTVLNSIGLDCDISVVETNKIKFASRRAGTDSKIIFKATVDGDGIDIFDVNYLDTKNATSEDGTNSTGTPLTEVLAMANEIAYCGGVLSTQIFDNDTIYANAEYMQTVDHVYYEVTKSLKNIGVLGKRLLDSELTNTRLLAYSMEKTKKAIATYATIAQSSDYTGADTALTMNLKTLIGIEPDTNLSQTYYNLAKLNGVDIYGTTEGLSCSYSFSNGDYTDEVTNELWMKKALIVAGFNYLRQTNTKIPQTESALEGLKNAYRTVLEQGIRNGVISTGLKWNNSIPFGDGEDFQENIKEHGYYIYSMPMAEQAQADREERKAPVVQIAVKLSGAIHSSNVIVNIQK